MREIKIREHLFSHRKLNNNDLHHMIYIIICAVSDI